MNNNTAAFHNEMQHLFDTLLKNLKAYDETTFQLEQPTSRSFWIELFQKVAQRNHIIYEHNGIIVQRIMELSRMNYSKDIKVYSDDLKYSELEELSKDNLVLLNFRILVETVFHSEFGKLLPFYVEQSLKSFEKDIVTRMPHSEITLLAYAGLMEAYGQIGMLNEKQSIRKMIQYATKILEFEDRYDTLSSDILRICILGAYRYLLFMAFIEEDGINLELAQQTWQRYQQFKGKHPNGFLINDPMLQKRVEYATVYIETFVPVTGLIYYKSVTPEKGTWLYDEMKHYIDNYTHPDFYTYRLFATSKWIMGEWTARQAYDEAVKYYNMLDWKPQNNRDAAQVCILIYTVKTILHLLAASDYPMAVKRVRIMNACELTLDEIRTCSSKHFDFEFCQAACDLITDREINAYLSTNMRRALIKGVYRSTLLQTYIRCRMISRLGEEILDAVIHYQPELLVGTLGTHNTAEVVKQGPQMNDFLTEAAAVMNIGKLSLIQVVRNNYLPLTKHELDLYEDHPRRGSQLLWIDPAMTQYRDVVLYHHKWYDGSNGYPSGDANTRSRYRFFTDILNIAHNIEAGTDEQWITYRKREPFQKIFPKLKREAGTRFNPDIVNLIAKHRDLYDKLCELTQEGWKHIYYEVYLDFFGWR